MQTDKKVRKMLELKLADGSRGDSLVNVPCTLQQYLRAINYLNHNAHLYGIVYLADPEDEDYKAFVNS